MRPRLTCLVHIYNLPSYVIRHGFTWKVTPPALFATGIFMLIWNFLLNSEVESEYLNRFSCKLLCLQIRSNQNFTTLTIGLISKLKTNRTFEFRSFSSDVWKLMQRLRSFDCKSLNWATKFSDINYLSYKANVNF